MRAILSAMRGILLTPLLLISSQIASAQPAAEIPTAEQWRADLAYLAKELPARHIKPFALISKADFEAQVKDLDARIPNLSFGATEAGLLKIVASLGDGHTTIQSWGRRNAFRGIPLVFYWHKDGVFVTGSTEQYRNLLGSKLLRIGKLSAEDTCRKLGIFVPHENQAQLKLQVMNMLMRFELLQDIGATEDADSIRLEFESAAKPVSVDFKPAYFLENPTWIRAYTGEPPLYRRDPEVPYSATLLEGGSIVYFRYNQCVSIPEKPFAKFSEELNQMLEQPGVRRLIVDLRNNSGGNSGILDPWITWLKGSPLNRKGSLFVLIGRPTFSSAILNAQRLRKETAATLVGEPTAGKPNHFGEVRWFELPNSHIRVSYSTKYFSVAKEDTPSLLPDIEVEPTSQDYLTGKDPVLAAVIR
jgi:hypothetical protein